MRVTKRQLRKIISEACDLAGPPAEELPEMIPAAIQPPTDEVPVPEDYNAVRDLLEQRPDYVNMAIAHLMDMAGTQCERSTVQGIIDHLVEMVGAAAEVPADAEEVPALPVGELEMIKGPGFM